MIDEATRQACRADYIPIDNLNWIVALASRVAGDVFDQENGFGRCLDHLTGLLARRLWR